MWKLWHKLFGWEYIGYNFVHSTNPYRVRTTPNGQRYIKVCGSISFIQGNRVFYHPSCPESYVQLTPIKK